MSTLQQGTTVSVGVKSVLQDPDEDGVMDTVHLAVSVDADGDDKNAAHPYSPQYRLSCMPECKWGHAPFDTHAVAEQWIDALTNHQCEVVEVPTAWGEGKEPDLDAARKSAVWPDATDEELSLPREEMKAVLEARGMPLQTEFKQAMHELGLQWGEEKKE